MDGNLDLLPTDAYGTPSRWLLVFRRRADVWWVNYCPGEFKHVSAFGYVHETDAWIFYDAGLCTTIYVARGTSARAMMLQRTRGDVCVLSMEPLPCPSSPRRPIFTCTAAIANLLAIPTIALRPDALYKACIKNGATVIQ
jgi:hypothetical protein